MNMQSDNLNELFSSLAKAQAEIKGAVKDSKNPFFKSTYADLSSVWAACRDPLSKNGLSVVQSVQMIDGQNVLVTTLGHSSGQWIKSVAPILCAKMDAQSYGSAITYMRRFSLAALVGVCPEDDDGEKAQARHPFETPAYIKDHSSYLKPSQSQVKELEKVLSICPRDFVDRVNAQMDIDNVATFSDLHIDSFKKVLDAAHKVKKIEKEKNA